MQQFRRVEVTIVATVFVPEHEIDGIVSTIRLDSEGVVTEQEAIEQLALDAVGKAIPTDEHMKIRDIIVDVIPDDLDNEGR